MYFFSSGAASYVVAKVVCEKSDKNNTILLFADTTIEDKDNYRFLIESSAFLDCQLVWLKDGRNPWDIYDEQKFVNHRVSNCSLELKVKPCKDFIMNNFKPNDCHLYMGITFDEYERSNAINKNWNEHYAKTTYQQIVVDGFENTKYIIYVVLILMAYKSHQGHIFTNSEEIGRAHV